MRGARSLIRRAGVVALITGTTGLVSLPASAQPAPQVSPSELSYGVVARADAFAAEVRDPSFPLVADTVVAYVSPTTSQALISSAGESQAFASAPYAGDLIVNLPGTVNGLAGGGFPPLPAYPVIVSSNYPLEPADEEEIGPYGIFAASDALRSSAEARIGLVTGATDLLASHATAEASLDPTTKVVTARAGARVEGFSIGPLLRIGTVSASATLTREADGDLNPSTSFSVGTITIGGIEVGLTDEGLALGTDTLPLLGVAPLLEQLRATGVGLRYLPSDSTANGVVSAGLELRYGTVVPGQGRVEVILTIGRVSASAQASNVVGGPSSTATAPTELLPAGAGSIAVPTVAPEGAPTAPSVAAQPVTLAAVPGDELRLAGLYLVLVAAASLLLGGSKAFALLGVGLRVRPDPRLLPVASHVLDLSRTPSGDP